MEATIPIATVATTPGAQDPVTEAVTTLAQLETTTTAAISAE